MWIARVSRSVGENVVKDEFCSESISELLKNLDWDLEDAAELLEIHIFREEKDEGTFNFPGIKAISRDGLVSARRKE